MVRVDEAVGIVAFADEEVSGHPDAVEIDPETTTGLDEHHRERDRHTEPTLEDVVEVGVARIVVVVAVAGEPLPDEDVLYQRVHGRLRAGRGDVVECRDAGRHDPRWLRVERPARSSNDSSSGTSSSSDRRSARRSAAVTRRP